MPRQLLGAICGIVFGVIDVLLMVPIPFPTEKDKTLAMAGAFVSYSVIGYVIGVARMSTPGWATGLILAVLINLPVSIITMSYIPILPVSAIGGAAIGFVVGRWGR
jgi:hypothetical protein